MIGLSEKKNRIGKILVDFSEQDFPTDLILVLLLLSAAISALYIPLLTEPPARYILTLPLVLFIPGYCLIAALFPKEGEIGLDERIMLSIGCSIAIVPLIGLGLNFTPWGIRFAPFVIVVTLFTLLMILIAHYQRALLPFEERFRISFSTIANTIKTVIFPDHEEGIDKILSIILVFVIIISMIFTIYVIVIPKEGERFTEFYILGEGQTSSDYPDAINVGSAYPMNIGIGNQEFRNVTYTIEIWSLVTEFDNVTNTSRIQAMDPIDRLSLTLAHNETRIIPYDLSVGKPGYNRIEFLLFNETIPGFEVTGNNRINASYRDLHLWVTVR